MFGHNTKGYLIVYLLLQIIQYVLNDLEKSLVVKYYKKGSLKNIVKNSFTIDINVNLITLLVAQRKLIFCAIFYCRIGNFHSVDSVFISIRVFIRAEVYFFD